MYVDEVSPSTIAYSLAQATTVIKMSTSSELVLYRPSRLTSRSYSSFLTSSNVFSQQTGTAIATELLYRIFFDILNRLLVSSQRLVSRSIDEASSFIKQKLRERREQRAAQEDSIVGQVEKLVSRREFKACPMTNNRGGRKNLEPPRWVNSVLQGIEEGRMCKEDFYTNQW